jgi:hypothetical protein
MHHIQEGTTAENKSLKVNLLEHEARNVNRMLDELLKARYRKILKNITKRQQVPSELLTAEETKMCETFASFAQAYQEFSKSLLQGTVVVAAPVQAATLVPPTQPTPTGQQTAPITVRVIESKPMETQPPTQKRLTVRFAKAIPAIMGADMKSYGPFNAEDVASLPAVNAKMLVKQGLAVQIEVS